MILIGGEIWAIHPMAIAQAHEAADHQRPSLSHVGERNVDASERFGMMRELEVGDLPFEIRDGVAVVSIAGVITSQASRYYPSHPVLQQAFRHLAEQQPSGGVVLLIDSPGGTSKGSAGTIDALNDLQNAGVKVTAQINGGCFSAAYKIACQCRGGVYMHRMDEVGSIGTKLILDDYSKWYADRGIRPIAITNSNGRYKALGDFGLPITPEHEAFLQTHVDEVFAEFERCVVKGRKLTDEQFAAVSDGRWWLPEEAQRLGLVDGVRTFEQTLVDCRPDDSVFRLSQSKEATVPKETDTKDAAAESKADDTKNETQNVDAGKTGEDKGGDAGESKAESKANESSTTESDDVKELSKWLALFGAENGSKWFVESDCDWQQACERHIAGLTSERDAATAERDKAREELQTTQKLLKDVSEKLAESDPLALEADSDTEKDEAGGKPKGASVRELVKLPGAAS